MNKAKQDGLKVAKFGGTSLADAAQVMKVLGIAKADPRRRIIVVSAPGKRHSEDTKVTDLLIACAESKLKGGTAEKEIQAVVARYAEGGVLQSGYLLGEKLIAGKPAVDRASTTNRFNRLAARQTSAKPIQSSRLDAP